MDHNIFIDVANAVVTTNLWKMIIIFIFTYVTGSIVKGIASTIYEYILIKTDIFGVGSLVEYKGKRGTIRNMGLRRIEIHIESEHITIFIRTFDWPKLKLIVPDYKIMEVKHDR